MAVMMGLDDQKRVRDWMMRNARPLELAIWRFHFENGSRGEVLRALAVYQNEDGGFGHALEADNWNPESTPYTTSVAADILHEIRFDGRHHPVVDGMLRYLEQTPHFTGRRWPACVPGNNNHPHAPWWTWDPAAQADPADPTDGAWGFTPTARLAGFILRFAEMDSEIFKKAIVIAKSAIHHYLHGSTPVTSGTLDNPKAPTEHAYRTVFREGEIQGLHALQLDIEELMKRANGAALEMLTADFANLEELKDALKQQVARFIVRDPEKWLQYGCKPSTFISGPDCLFYKGNEDILQTELDFMLKRRNADGVWTPVWQWGGYDREFAISQNWWTGTVILWHMLRLKSFGRLEGAL